MQQPFVVFAVLFLTIGLFIWGYWRYDVVAFIALMTLVILKAVPFSQAFIGFSNPAVITVACVMILSDAIAQSGLLDWLVKKMLPVTSNAFMHVTSLCVITGVLSAFMNNVGALALMMPVAIQTSVSAKRSPSLVLMPCSFASVLGGLTTSIGTPPNLLISSYRELTTGHPYSVFDFTPVGLSVAVVTVIFIAIIGWQLLPSRKKVSAWSEEMFQIQDYITEVVVPEKSDLIDTALRQIENNFDAEFSIVGFIRGRDKYYSVPAYERVRAKDILIVEASHEELDKFIELTKCEIVGDETVSSAVLKSADVGLVEAVVSPGARIENRSWQQLRIRSRYHINLLAIARQGKPFKKRLSHVNLSGGDVVLLQGDLETMGESMAALGLLPLVERGVQMGMKKSVILPTAVFILAIVLAAFGHFPVQISFSLAVLALVLFNVIPARRLYKNIDWSIICLLGAMIPIGDAMQRTGGTELIANTLLSLAGSASPMLIIGCLMVITMTLSDLMNNAATAVVMAPLAVSIAGAMQLNVDPFLMAVAVGASCSFLTPISHQNNTLVMGPGGYKFIDFMRLGLPVEIIVLVTGLPMIMWTWPIK